MRTLARTPLYQRPSTALALAERTALASDPLLTLAQAIELLGVSYGTARAMVAAGELKVWRRGNGTKGWMRVRLSEVKRAVAAGFGGGMNAT